MFSSWQTGHKHLPLANVISISDFGVCFFKTIFDNSSNVVLLLFCIVLCIWGGYFTLGFITDDVLCV